MIDYSTPPAGRGRPGRGYPPGRRPPRRAAAGIVAIVAVAGALVARHELTAHPAPQPKHSAPPQFESTPTSLHLGACIDPTLSIVPSFAPAIRHDLAAAVGLLTPPTGAPATRHGAPARPATSLLVREVDTTSFSSVPGPYATSLTVPGVPGLTRARPVPSDPNYASDLAKWSLAAEDVTAAEKAAAAGAASAARTVAALPLDQNPNSNSAITACVSALLVNSAPGGRHSYLLASDLEENVAPQLDGSFRGAPLIIVQTCDNGDVSTCQALLRHFETLMHRLDVGPMTVIRPEQAGSDIAQWIRTGEVTP